MSTIKRIAERCGVSSTTVSNILNNKGRVGEETRKKVLEVVEELQFSPNTFARTLKAPDSIRTIGIITEDLTVFNTPEIVDGIEEACEKQGYGVVINNLRFYKRFKSSFYNTEKHHAHIANEIREMMGQRIEGAVYVGCHARNLAVSARNFRIPIVFAYSFTSDGSIPSVIFDDEKAAYDATSALLKNNRSRIGVITGNENSIHTRQRLLGYQKALFEHGILYDPNLVVSGGWEFRDGYAASGKLLEEHVDGIFAMNDLIAGGVISYAKDNGYEIGTKVALVGFDDQDVCTAYSPSLSTMALPLTGIGNKAADVVLDMIRASQAEHVPWYDIKKDPLIKIPCTYISRDSVQ